MIVVNIFELLIVLDKLFDKEGSEGRAKKKLSFARRAWRRFICQVEGLKMKYPERWVRQ